MSLLLDARKKVELALEQSGVHRAVEPQLSETLRLEDSSAGGRDAHDPHHATTQRVAPAGGTPTGAPKVRNPLPAETGAELSAPPPGAHSDPRTAGQNLFAAKAAPVRTGGRLGIIPIAIISGVVLAAGGGYYIWREISPPPVMQRHNPAPAPAPATPIANATPPAVPVTQTAPAPAVPAVESTHAQANVDINPDYPLDTRFPPPARGRAREGVETLSSHRANPHPNLPPKRGKERVGSNEQSGMKQIDHAPKVAAPRTPPAAPHDTAAQPIRIEHAQEGDAVDPTLLAAYQAYRNGDPRTAWQLYGDVLKKDGKNRDALLGMAAIAQQQSQDAIATRYYNQVLMLDPRDPIANAGMSALLGTSDVANTESRLKLLLAQQLHSAGTQSSALHFALGNLYAEQSRWGDAQQAYFNAYNLEQGNAQFAFNLAVSLDHLGQGKLAAQHYQRALQLDLSDNPGFNRAQTQQRVNELTAP